MIYKCIICQQWFETPPNRKRCCTRVKCRIKMSYKILHNKGYDPEMYYQQLIVSKYKVRCKLCNKEICARFVRDFFYPICKECEDREKEIFWPCIDEINKDAIEESCGFILPSSFLEIIKNTWKDD